MVRKRYKKFESKNLLPLVLFLVILINYIPLIKVNFEIKESKAVELIPMVSALGISCLLLVGFYIKKIKLSLEMLINFALLMIVSIISLVVQIIAYKSNNYEILDFANIACKFVNVFLLIILLMNLEIEEKYLNIFMICMVLMGIIACVYNILLYYEDILGHLSLINYELVPKTPKSFFSHKNQFALFLYTSIIATCFLLNKKYNIFLKMFLLLSLILFFGNIFLSFSRTGLAVAVIFIVLYYLFPNKIKLLPKIILTILLISVGYIIINKFIEYNPSLIGNVLRLDTIKTFTGRSEFWNIAEEQILSDRTNLIFGVGRFKAEKLIEKFGVTQFHNTYIEFLVSGGIIEFVYFVGLGIMILIKVLRSKMHRTYRSLYLAMFISYAIYMCFESIGRFSIGCSDTLCLIFFFSIPLLHATSNIKELKPQSVTPDIYVKNDNNKNIEELNIEEKVGNKETINSNIEKKEEQK